jgi:hypothetical protein
MWGVKTTKFCISSSLFRLTKHVLTETGTFSSRLLQHNFIRTPAASWSSSSCVPYSASCRTRPDNKKTLARSEMTGSQYKERIYKKGRITFGAMFGLPASPEQGDDGPTIKNEAHSTLVHVMHAVMDEIWLVIFVSVHNTIMYYRCDK